MIQDADCSECEYNSVVSVSLRSLIPGNMYVDVFVCLFLNVNQNNLSTQCRVVVNVMTRDPDMDLLMTACGSRINLSLHS